MIYFKNITAIEGGGAGQTRIESGVFWNGPPGGGLLQRNGDSWKRKGQ